MSKENNKQNQEQKQKLKPLDEIEPCTIEDIILDNIAPKKVRLRVEGKNGKAKEVRCVFRKLEMDEALLLGGVELTNKGTQLYQRQLLHIASITPKFADPVKDPQWWKDNRVTEGFVRNYVQIINEHAGKNDFLLNEPSP